MKRDSIIFDLDGTLWDSSRQIAKSWSQTLREKFPDIHKEITQKDIMGIMGMVTEDIARTLFPDLEIERAITVTNTICEEECDYLRKTGGTLYDGVEEVLEALSLQYPLFIVSNCQCGYIEWFLEHHKLDKYFKGFLCSGQTGKRKGENIKRLMEQYGLKKSIYVGDTQMDYEAAKQAGIEFLYAAYGFGTISDPVPSILSIRELLNHMQE